MSAKHRDSPRNETDISLHAERENADRELARRVVVAEEDADEVLRMARERADRLLATARSAADARLPWSEQTRAAIALLIAEREEEDRALAAERGSADALLARERLERRRKLSSQLVLERQTTDLHLALERNTADQAVTSRDDFLAQASHDLRGLLAAQKIYLSLLAKETDGAERSPLGTYVAALVTIDGQMDRMVSDLVDVVAIDAGKLAVKLGPDSAAELLSSALAVFEPLARERGQAVSMSATAGDLRVMVDTARGVQVLGNLLSNAIKFTPRGGKIRLGCEARDDEVVFFVEDSGPGIAAEQAEHIFERFVGGSTSGAPSGLGLGLFIAARIVEAHGGRLWFDRDRAAGSMFRFTLKRAR